MVNKIIDEFDENTKSNYNLTVDTMKAVIRVETIKYASIKKKEQRKRIADSKEEITKAKQRGDDNALEKAEEKLQKMIDKTVDFLIMNEDASNLGEKTYHRILKMNKTKPGRKM